MDYYRDYILQYVFGGILLAGWYMLQYWPWIIGGLFLLLPVVLSNLPIKKRRDE